MTKLWVCKYTNIKDVMENLITLAIEEEKQAFLLELLTNFDFVEIQDNTIWEEIVANKNTKEMKKSEDKKPKRFTDFTLYDVKEIFGIEEQETNLFANIENISLSEWLKETLEKAKNRKLNNEKTRSEALVYPISCEIETISKYKVCFFFG